MTLLLSTPPLSSRVPPQAHPTIRLFSLSMRRPQVHYSSEPGIRHAVVSLSLSNPLLVSRRYTPVADLFSLSLSLTFSSYPHRYTPVADLDYGTLSCAASNEVGAQLQPCVFQMVAAGMYTIYFIYLYTYVVL